MPLPEAKDDLTLDRVSVPFMEIANGLPESQLNRPTKERFTNDVKLSKDSNMSVALKLMILTLVSQCINSFVT